MYSSYKKVFLLALSLPLFAALVLSGSRGAVLAFLMGAVVYLLPYRRSKRVLATILLISLAISALVYFVARNVDFSERWEESYSEHDFAGREQIFPVAAEMIFERPLLGWSVDGFYELGRRFGGMWAVTGRDPHNLYLGVLLQAGVIGAIPFFIGLGLCGRSAWRARSEPLQLLPLVLLIAMLVVGMSNTHLNSKMYWLILALGTALGSGTRKFPNRVVASPLPSRAPKYNRFQV